MTREDAGICICVITLLVAVLGSCFLQLEAINTQKDDYINSVYDMEINNLNSEIDFWKSEYSELEEKLWIETQKPPEKEIEYITKYITSPKIITDFYLPTKIEIKRILRLDNTDENEWSKQYDCTEFSSDVIALLYSKGIFSCMVEIDYYDGKDYGHHFVAVNTTEGVIYIEPQDDSMFDFLSLESNYCDHVGWNCDWTIKKIGSCY